MGDDSLTISIGGAIVRIPDLRREPDIQAALGLFLRALADSIDPQEVHDASSQSGPVP